MPDTRDRKTIAAYILLSAMIAGVVGFIAGGLLVSRMHADDYNSLASGNFRTALTLFRDGYHRNYVVLFGEQEEHAEFQAGGITFHVIPAKFTIDFFTPWEFNKGISNSAAHMNGMVVMLACKWIEDQNPAGAELLDKLKEYMPNFMLSAPRISPLRVADLTEGSPMMESRASQWRWRMESCSADPFEQARYGCFIDDLGEHVIEERIISLHVYEDEPGRINYRVVQDDGKRHWGPVEAPFANDGSWFFYVESRQRIWLSHGESLILLEWDETESGTYGVLESCDEGPDWRLVKEIPDPVRRRLPESVMAVITAEPPVE